MLWDNELYQCWDQSFVPASCVVHLRGSIDQLRNSPDVRSTEHKSMSGDSLLILQCPFFEFSFIIGHYFVMAETNALIHYKVDLPRPL